MALEAALWQRVKRGGKHLRACGYGVHLCRVENDAGSGHPDVEGAIDGIQIWVELKSCSRPKRDTTPCRPKLRTSQEEWMGERIAAGERKCFVLIQVGEAHSARLYLIPGHRYVETIAPESYLAALSVCDPASSVPSVLLRATEGFEL